MWEMERDGANEGVKEKRSQLDHQHLAHQSFCHQDKCCVQMCRSVVDQLCSAVTPGRPGEDLLKVDGLSLAFLFCFWLQERLSKRM